MFKNIVIFKGVKNRQTSLVHIKGNNSLIDKKKHVIDFVCYYHIMLMLV